nr:uncharacterized protein LOC110149055 [Odocoileus virginianus texanus]
MEEPGEARSPLPSHPGNPEFFPCGCGWGFWGCAGLQQAQADVGSEACGLVVSIPQERAGWSEPHPAAREAQCRLQVSVPTEGSAQGEMERKQGRPAAQTPPRTHPGAQSRAATGLSTPGSDPEPRGPNPLRQHEDLEPSAAEHTALALTFKYNQAPLPSPIPTEVVATCAGPRDPLRGGRDLSLLLPKTPGQLGTGQHPEKIGPLCLHDRQSQAPMSHPLSLNVHLHLHLHLHLLRLWQENLTQGMSYHLCWESPPWLLLKTQTPTMTDQPLQGERAPVLDRDPESVPETPGPGEPWALRPRSLSASRGCHHLAPHPGETEIPSLEGLFIWFVCSLLVIFFYGRAPGPQQELALSSALVHRRRLCPDWSRKATKPPQADLTPLPLL